MSDLDKPTLSQARHIGVQMRDAGVSAPQNVGREGIQADYNLPMALDRGLERGG